MPEPSILTRPDAQIAYYVDGALPPAGGERPLVMIGQPMDASGFAALTAEFGDRTVVRYDPRGFGASTRDDGTRINRAEVQAEDVHALIAEIGGGPVDLLASSGGAITALALVQQYPEDVAVLVAHEPPLMGVLPDAQVARRAYDVVSKSYAERGFGAGMAGFIHYTSWQGEFTDAYFELAVPEPAAFGLPDDDSGDRSDPLLSDVSDPIVDFKPDWEAIKRAPTRVVLAVGEETGDAFTARTARAVARLLGQVVAVFPSHHGGFSGGEHGYPGKPAEFAVKLREVLAG